MYAPFTAEDAERGRERQRELYEERKKLEADAYRKAYSDVLQKLLKQAGALQAEVLERALQEIQSDDPDAALVRLGTSVANTVADRNMGKVAQRFEGNVNHTHSVLDDMAARGELDAVDVEAIEDAEVLELGAGDDVDD